jgi:hypothetical protein
MKHADLLLEGQQDMRAALGYAPLAGEYQKHTPHHFVVPSSDRGELSKETRCAEVQKNIKPLICDWEASGFAA